MSSSRDYGGSEHTKLSFTVASETMVPFFFDRAIDCIINNYSKMRKLYTVTFATFDWAPFTSVGAKSTTYSTICFYKSAFIQYGLRPLVGIK
jgi:hypothetical protein